MSQDVLGSVADPDPGSGMGKKSGSGSGMKNPDHIFECLEIIFFGLKYLNSLRRTRDPGWKKLGSGIWDTGSGMEKIQIRDKHPGSATLVLRNL
jgi:hypothetical protein